MTDGDEQATADWAAVADAVKARARAVGKTQKVLATEAGVALATIQEFWRGTPRKRHPRVLASISEALGWPSNRLAVMLGEATEDDVPSETQESALLQVVAEMRSMREELRDLSRRFEALQARLGKD